MWLRLLIFAFCLPFLITPSTSENQLVFTDITQKSKIDFIHDPKVGGKYSFPEVMGSGCALFDYDNDNDLDIYLVNGSDDRLYRQESDGTFVDVSTEAGLNDPGYGMGVAIGDVDNDGDPDVFVTNYGEDHLYRNNGNGTFTNITKQSGIQTTGWSTSTVFFDYDRDGFLDLYIARYVKLNPAVVCTDRAGRKDYCGPDGYEAEPDLLFHNNGDGTFQDVSTMSGINRIPRKGLGVVSADFNADNYPDLYVANDREPNHLWINTRNGKFQDQALASGAALNAMGQSEASMGIAVGDVNQDGLPDLFITNLRDETNTLYVNKGKLGFQDDSLSSGLGLPSLPYTGFGTGFLDFNHDGNLDVAVVNGRVTRGVLLTKKRTSSFWDDYAEPNLLFENSGSRRFTKASSLTSDLQNGRGMAFGDIDNDGDIDLLINNCGGSARLLRNDIHPKGHWISIRAIDPKLNRDAYGAKITISAAGKNIIRWVNPGYSYLTSNDPRVHFGLGAATTIDRIQALWPDGTSETFPAVQADQILMLRKGSSK
ncbi:MAG TPA: CRTAC1 family protein [Acidobacteriota bacterium]|nr:CRTAC1 family protein [Acidobacteriota bacterium]